MIKNGMMCMLFWIRSEDQVKLLLFFFVLFDRFVSKTILNSPYALNRKRGEGVNQMPLHVAFWVHPLKLSSSHLLVLKWMNQQLNGMSFYCTMRKENCKESTKLGASMNWVYLSEQIGNICKHTFSILNIKDRTKLTT